MLGRQISALPGRQALYRPQSTAAAAVQPRRRLLLLGPLQTRRQRRCAAAAEQAGQAAISIGTEAAAIGVPPQQQQQLAHTDGTGIAGSNNNSSSSGNNSHAVQASDAVQLQAAAGGAAATPQQQQQQQQPGKVEPQAEPAEQTAKKGSTFVNRVVFGVLLGVGGAAVVAKGSLLYLCAAMFVVYHATQEFYGLLTSSGISQGMPPPSRFVSVATTALCLSITAFTYFSHGRSGAAMCAAAFCLLVMNILASPKPKFAQLASSVFGLLYCGYLPSFWIKLRNIDVAGPVLQLPGVSDEVVASISALLPNLTVGLVATLTTVACIIAADTGAYFVGKNLGRTKLTDISPKKTVEGAVGGLASAVAVALLFWQLFSWPGSAVAAAGYGVLTFTSSLFGDLIESIMKRDAGLKDSGNLIPGHGGLLDRFDSYIFSGALGYFYIVAVLPRFGLI